MEILHGAQTTYQIGYHMVWGVKYCRHVLNNTMKQYLVDNTKEICEAYEYHFMCIGIAPNHVHLFIGAPPKIAPAKVAQTIKSITARNLYKEFPQLRRQLYGGEIWKNGYYVGTIGEGQTEDKVRMYIAKQGKHSVNTMKQLKLFF
jgi:putative transposase